MYFNVTEIPVILIVLCTRFDRSSEIASCYNGRITKQNKVLIKNVAT